MNEKIGDIRHHSEMLVAIECENCGETARYRNTYLDDRNGGARRNPDSSAYGKDDCSLCSDHDQFLCSFCHQRKHAIGVPDGFSWCSTYENGERFAHMFRRWERCDIARPKILDNDRETISVLVNGNEMMSWVYSDRDSRREKMRHAHYWCDGFMCASGALRKSPGQDKPVNGHLPGSAF